MVNFKTEKISNRVTRIFGICTELMYLIEGDSKAILIDTGSGFGSLKRVVQDITQKETLVLLTHGHTDHAMGAVEFKEVYMNHEDDYIFVPHGDMGFRMDGLQMSAEKDSVDADEIMETADYKSFYDLSAGMCFDIGGIHIDVYAIPGHTKGSVAFLLREEGMLLTGDACNNFTFMFEDYSLPISLYYENLIQLNKDTKGKYSRLLSSHKDGELSLDTIENVIHICEEIMEGKAEDIPMTFRGNTGYIARKQSNTGKVGGNIVYNKNNIFPKK